SKAEILEQIPSMIRQAAPMRIHVANSDFARDPWIKHLECGIERAQFRVPGYFSLADEFGNHSRANRLRDRRQLEHRVSIHRCFCVYIAHSKSFRVHDFVLKHDCDGETGYRILVNLLLREFLDLLNSVRYLLGGDMRLLRWCR